MDLMKFKPLLAGMFAELYNFQWDDINKIYIPTTTHTLAYAQAPQTLADSDLPVWIIFTKAATYPVPPDSSEDRKWHETRDFDCKLFVEHGQAGIDGEAEAKVEPYLDPALTLIHNHPLLQSDTAPLLCPGIQRGYLVNDKGVTTLVYGKAGDQYVGLWFTLRVEVLNMEPEYAQGQ